MYKVEVQADSTGTWVSNQLTFENVGEATKYARDLFFRWTAVRAWRVVDNAGNVHTTSGGK